MAACKVFEIPLYGRARVQSGAAPIAEDRQVRRSESAMGDHGAALNTSLPSTSLLRFWLFLRYSSRTSRADVVTIEAG